MDEMESPDSPVIIVDPEKQEQESDSEDESKSEIYPTSGLHTCHCGERFDTLRKLNNHRERMHDEATTSFGKSKRCPLCGFESQLRSKMINHFIIEHDISLTEEEIIFPSKEAFLKWKTEIEFKTLSRFICNRGICTAKAHKSQTYLCHRSGKYRKTGKGIRSFRRLGSLKLNSYCPASMILKYKADGTCHVFFTSTHVGHETEFRNLAITPRDQSKIAKKISANTPIDTIFDEIRDLFVDPELQRIALLTNQNKKVIAQHVSSITKLLNTNAEEFKVDMWIDRLKRTQSESVIYHKPEGDNKKELPFLNLNDFVLIIMTYAQMKVLIQNGSKCICLDRINVHRNNCLELNTLLVLDERNEGFPCAFMIANRSDKRLIQFFISKIKENVGAIQPGIFMSDYLKSYSTVWNLEMGESGKKLYCSWLLDRDWRKMLYKVRGKENQTAVYKHLRTLLAERDVEVFQSALSEFCASQDPNHGYLINFFEAHLNENTKQWAHCHFSEDDILTSLRLERTHRFLKAIYMPGINKNRLDKSISSIMSFVRDLVITKPTYVNNSEFRDRIHSRHKDMTVMSPTKIYQLNEGLFAVTSENGEELYSIGKRDITCVDCSARCFACKICIHQYQCSCCDSTICCNMCKHIHLIASLNGDSGFKEEMDVEDIPDMSAQSPETNYSDCESLEVDKEELFEDSKLDARQETAIRCEDSILQARKETAIQKYVQMLQEVNIPAQQDYIEHQLLSIKSKLAAIKRSCGGA